MTAHEVILGTAGHIDHGKTALVRALTGVDTDRLEEEKRRGISIDIGFAHVELPDDTAQAPPVRLGIVDVPGHERFVRNMLAGVSGIDVALLVVAADDSVMPQTREHLEILQLLDVQDGIIALTKCDLADAAWLDLVEGEVRALAAGTFLAAAPIVRTSTITGAGLEELRRALAALCRRHRRRPLRAQFRMAVDRSFALRGLGTVITGTIWHGAVGVGDEIECLPEGRLLRVRRVQSHNEEVSSASQGRRAALNVTGARHAEIRRGHVVAAPGSLAAARCVTVAMRALPDAPAPLRHRARMRLHLGTQETTARLLLLEGTSITPGARALGQLLTETPVVAAARQPFVIRSLSPARTIGGGHVLLPDVPRIARRDRASIERLQALAGADDRSRVAIATWFGGADPGSAETLARRADVDPARAVALVGELRAEGALVELPPGGTVLHRDVAERLRGRAIAILQRLHAEDPAAVAVPVERVRRGLAALPAAVFAGVLHRLREDGTCTGNDQAVALAGRGPRLTEAQRVLRDALLTRYRQAGFQPPTLRELAAERVADERSLRGLADVLVAGGDLVHLDADLYMDRRSRDEALRRLREGLEHPGGGLTVSEIKTMLGTSRKYAVPLCEHLDRAGFTARRGDRRVLAAGVANHG